MSFFDKLNNAIICNQTLLIVGLDPNPEMMPHHYKSGANNETLIANLRDWMHFIIAETSDLVCAYKPTLGFYEVLGSEGWQLLSEVLAAIPADIPIILDAKHGDINTSSALAHTIFTEWNVDAVTLNPYGGQDHAAPFLLYPDRGVFILCRTSNPGAIALQEYPTAEAPLYLQVVEEAKTWGTPEQLFLEVGTTDAKVLAKIREIAPERIILVRSLWSAKENFDAILQAGLDKQGNGLLVPIPQDLLIQETFKDQVNQLRQQIETKRQEIQQADLTCDLWTPDVCLLKKHPHQDLILQIYDIGCILFGEYVQASGATFSYYIDLRRIISNPQIFHKILHAYAEILRGLTFDRLAGIPYGSLPTATGLSLLLERPMIYPRKEVKAHGTRRVIEGEFQSGETVVVVDDILITGKSAIEGAEKIKSVGLEVQDIVVFIDHEEGVKKRLQEKGYRAYSVLTISEITETLYEAGRITEAQFSCLKK